MSKVISSSPRPTIPYEHPDARMHFKLFKENIIRLKDRKPAYTKNDQAVRELFNTSQDNLKDKCEQLVSYVAEAFSHYAVLDNSHAYYPGRPSQQGARMDALEGVSRVLPTLAVWLHANGAEKKLKGLNGKVIDIINIIKTSFLAGTNPTHSGYWGKPNDYDQRVCESADLALVLWLSKEWVWDHLQSEQQRQVLDWFKEVNHCQIVDNNWHLFPLTVQLVIKSLSGEDCVDQKRYQRIKEFYVGEGWFRDGAKGNYDYYNAWGFFYSLYWLDQIDPSFDREFIQQAHTDFVSRYRYFFTAKGIPFFGRSACYRLAASAPLLAAIDQGSDAIAVGEARRAFHCNLRYFISNGALANGAPTQGLFDDDVRLIDNYSGPASSFWSLRGLNIAIYSGDRSGLWEATETPLPIEQEDFSFTLPTIDAQVIGTRKTQEVVVIFNSDYTDLQSPLLRRLLAPTWLDCLSEKVTGRARRPKNNLLRKGITCYSSKMSHFF